MSTETPAFIVRAATSADAPQLGKLAALLVETHYAFDAQRFLPVTDRTQTEYGAFLARQLNDPNVVLLVAEEHGEMQGYAYATVEGYDYQSLRGPAGVLQDLIVEAEVRGRGVGSHLLEAILSELKSRGVSQVVLSTAAQNEGARRLFARAGFRPTMIEMTRDLDK